MLSGLRPANVFAVLLRALASSNVQQTTLPWNWPRE